jgi:hypothetical protein
MNDTPNGPEDRPDNVRPLLWKPKPTERIDPKLTEPVMPPEHVAATDALVGAAMAFEREHGFRFSWQCFADHDSEPAVDALATEILEHLEGFDLGRCRLIAALVAAEAQLEAASFAFGGVTEHMRSHQLRGSTYIPE